MSSESSNQSKETQPPIVRQAAPAFINNATLEHNTDSQEYILTMFQGAPDLKNPGCTIVTLRERVVMTEATLRGLHNLMGCKLPRSSHVTAVAAVPDESKH